MRRPRMNCISLLGSELVLEGGVGGMKSGGFSFKPEIQPSEISFLSMSKLGKPPS